MLNIDSNREQITRCKTKILVALVRVCGAEKVQG